MSKTDAFTEKVVADTSAAAVIILATLGDRLGLFRALANREPATPARLEENAGPRGALLYAWSLLYCLTTSLARGGEGLGAAGLPEPKLRELCAEAGFSKVRRVLSARPFHTLYEIQL